jgi:hypothetical protein
VDGSVDSDSAALTENYRSGRDSGAGVKGCDSRVAVSNFVESEMVVLLNRGGMTSHVQVPERFHH